MVIVKPIKELVVFLLIVGMLGEYESGVVAIEGGVARYDREINAAFHVVEYLDVLYQILMVFHELLVPVVVHLFLYHHQVDLYLPHTLLLLPNRSHVLEYLLFQLQLLIGLQD